MRRIHGREQLRREGDGPLDAGGAGRWKPQVSNADVRLLSFRATVRPASVLVSGGRRRVPNVVETLLGIYLRDQLAMGVLWRELARRAQRHNRGTALGDALDHVALGIAEDVDTFASIMRELGVGADRVKVGLAMAAERFGRFKLNGRVGSYSPLSRFEELEFLAMGIDGKKQMWSTLRDLASLGSRLPDVDFGHLIERAEAQRAELEPFRVRAGREAFGTGSS